MIVHVCSVYFVQMPPIHADKNTAPVSKPKILWELCPFTRTRHIETTDADQQATKTSDKQRVDMVLCAAPNCNVQYGQEVAMFSFPTDTKYCDVWVRKLKTVDYWPSKHSKLCERHFTEDCFVIEPTKARSLGYTRLQLKKEAIPTQFDYTPLHVAAKGQKRKTDSADPPIGTKPKCRTSRAVEKRRSSIEIEVDDNLQVIIPPPPQFQDNQQNHCASNTTDDPAIHNDDGTDSYEMATQTTYGLIKRRHVSLQTDIRIAVTSTGTQTEFEADCPPVNLNESLDSISSTGSTESEWIPQEKELDMVVNDENNNPHDVIEVPHHRSRKFVVFEECLDKLLNQCTICGQKCVLNKNVVGSMLSVSRICICGEIFTWESQPLIGSMPVGNLVLSAAILISGNSIAQNLVMFSHANIACFSERTFHNIQHSYLVPAVERVWKAHQDTLFDNIRQDNTPVIAGGDARCCSPGHTAKYGSYSLMDLERQQILDVKLVQSNEVKSSYWMELEGLKRCLHTVEEDGIVITDLVTDRHSQVKAFMKKERSDVNHWFDVWHVAKGVFKKLEASGKKKKCQKVGDWARSVSNHLYWCAASSDGNGELVLEKWLSVLNHVVNIHDGHGKLFPSCLHGELEDRDWIKKGSLAFIEMEKVVKGRLLVKDVKQISPAEQTSALEAYHKIVCHFAPKSLHFFYAPMKARLYIAALHFNENSCRDQATNRNGEPIFAVSYPKGRHGNGVPKEVKVKQTYNYAIELMQEVVNVRLQFGSYRNSRQFLVNAVGDSPATIASSYHRESKSDIISSHVSRFNKRN